VVVGPAEAEQLAASHAGRRGQHQRRLEPFTLDQSEELA
jgi:hypothetical protein